MSGQTPRFSLSFFDDQNPGSLDDDGGKYTGDDRLTLDRLLAALEAHNHHLSAPTSEPANGPGLAYTTDGTLNGGTTYYYVLSFVNADGLETAAGPETSISTPDLLPIPAGASGETTTGGTLQAGQYYYALSGLRGEEETPLSEVTVITVTSAERTVVLTLPALGDATELQVWRMKDSDSGWTRVGTSSTTTFSDTGAVPAGVYGDPANSPPLLNAGVANYAITVTLSVPDAAALAGASGWRIYRSTESGAYGAQSLVHEVVERTDDADPDSPLMTDWLDDGDAPLTGSPKLFSQEMRVTPYAFESASILPPTAGYPENYPILNDTSGALFVNKAGTWTGIGTASTGPTGPTGASGPIGVTGATGASGTPGSGGSGGGAISAYDGGATYSTGDTVYTSLGLYTALSGVPAGTNPDFYSPFNLVSRGASTVSSSTPNAAGHDRLSRRFQVNADTSFAYIRMQFADTYAGGASLGLSSTDPATTYTEVAAGTLPGGTGLHTELVGFSGLTLSANTDYWIVVGGDAGQHIQWQPSAGFNTLTGVVSLTADTRYSDAATGVGTTATADTHQFGFDLLVDPDQYWILLAHTQSLFAAAAPVAYDLNTLYPQGSIVIAGNGLYVNQLGIPLQGYDPAAGLWTLVAWIVPAGGTTGQVLTKLSNTDGDYTWSTP